MSEAKRTDNQVLQNKLLKESEMAEEKETPKKLSRREFVKGAAVGAAGATAAGVLASCAPAATPAPGQTAAPAATCPPAAECAPCVDPRMPETWDEEADVVVVGCGGAGAAAAITANDAGAKVLVLEKMPVGGGTTALSGGNFSAPKAPLNLDRVVGYLVACGKGLVDEEMATAWAQEAINVPDWAKALGGDVVESPGPGYHPQYEGAEEIVSWAPAQATGAEMYKILSDAMNTRGIEVMLETPATELVATSEGEVVGVVSESNGTKLYVKAKRAVILTCGGFDWNDWMKQQYLRVHPVYSMASPGNTGDAIAMAGKLGAKLWKISELAGFVAHKFAGDERTWLSMLQFVIGNFGAIIVSKYGKRFTDETLSYDAYHKALDYFDPATDDYPNVPCYCMFDEAARLAIPMGYGPGWSADNLEEIEKGWIVKADTIKELGSKIGIDPETLDSTVSQYNQYCTAGQDPDFGRKALKAFGAPPYYAIEGYPGTTSTWGGPKINTKAQVEDTYEQVIPRLYTAGVASCGVQGFYYPGNGSNLGDCFAFGCIAGWNAAAEEPWE